MQLVFYLVACACILPLESHRPSFGSAGLGPHDSDDIPELSDTCYAIYENGKENVLKQVTEKPCEDLLVSSVGPAFGAGGQGIIVELTGVYAGKVAKIGIFEDLAQEYYITQKLVGITSFIQGGAICVTSDIGPQTKAELDSKGLSRLARSESLALSVMEKAEKVSSTPDYFELNPRAVLFQAIWGLATAFDKVSFMHNDIKRDNFVLRDMSEPLELSFGDVTWCIDPDQVQRKQLVFVDFGMASMHDCADEDLAGENEHATICLREDAMESDLIRYDLEQLSMLYEGVEDPVLGAFISELRSAGDNQKGVTSAAVCDTDMTELKPYTEDIVAEAKNIFKGLLQHKLFEGLKCHRQ